MSGINYREGKLRPDPDFRWYWPPVVATWIYSIIVIFFMSVEWRQYMRLRQQYLTQWANKTASKSLLICNLPENIRSDKDLESWMEGLNLIQYPIEQALMGRYNSQLTNLMPEYESTVRHLENTLASYLNGNVIPLSPHGKRVSPNRPVKRIRGVFTFIGCQKVDAIDYYTKRIIALETKIKKLRSSRSKPANYGWIRFARIEWAYRAKTLLQESDEAIIVKPAPLSKDVQWTNLAVDEKTRRLKRWYGWGLFWSLMFLWLGPISALSALSNIVNLIRLLPDTGTFLSDYSFAMCLIQGYLTPILMAILFYALPPLFRQICKRQAYCSETTLERKVLMKLYIFFVLNNFVAFTITSMFIGIFGQTKSLIVEGAMYDHDIPHHIAQMAKNIADVSSFWINYVCVKSAGATLEIAQVLPLISLSLQQLMKRLSPRKLRQLALPPAFDYPRNYNIILFFFTVSLVYSAMAPLVLPFALLYFVIATTVYKYMLMYVYVTKVESGGKMWPVLFHTIMASVILFQLVMFVMLQLKSGNCHSYALIPLPLLTLCYQYIQSRRMRLRHPITESNEQDLLSSTSSSSSSSEKSAPNGVSEDPKDAFIRLYSDPALHSKLLRPMIHDDVKHLLSQVYQHQMGEHGDAQTNTQLVGVRVENETHVPVDSEERHESSPTNPNYRSSSRTTVLFSDHESIQFYAVPTSDIQEIRDDNDDGNDLIDDLYWPSAPPIYIFPTLEEQTDRPRNSNTAVNERSICPTLLPSAPSAEENYISSEYSSKKKYDPNPLELPSYEESAAPSQPTSSSMSRPSQPRRRSAPAAYP
ncbi:hypothetical protein EC973_004526 [Apophysomyces ossiformis]|uniref:DUF221-domain-containing protein n=1 Tax=Apophysomyces ossiformis TaxID=679940 RepID=A0A8H7ELP8_9FUNG|nr:hypothetical protein EC973_004526 [Apophysomyces ossiformis]